MQRYFIIQCRKDTVLVEKYETFDAPLNDKSYRDGGTEIGPRSGHGFTVVYKKSTALKLHKDQSWNNFFDTLIKHGLFEIPGDPEFSKKINISQPHINVVSGKSIAGAGLGNCIEIKLNEHYRILHYVSTYSPEPKNSQLYNNLLQILNTLNNFEK